MTSRNLGQQFSHLLEGAAELGVERGDHPGTVRIGGLHVPASSVISVPGRPTEHGTLAVSVPDEHGNLFGALVTPSLGTFRGGVNGGAQFSSPEELADHYGTLAPPEPHVMERNRRSMSMERSIHRSMGVDRGLVLASAMPGPGSGTGVGHFRFDPETGDVSEPAMPWMDAYHQWEREQAGR